MPFLSGKHLPRRTFLRGMGATVALPFLDAMVPAGRAWKEVAAAAGLDRPRLVAIEMVHGAAGCSAWGATQNLWSPAAVGRDFDLTPTAMISLEPYRRYLTIVSNTDVRMAEAFDAGEIGADHFRSAAVFLTQAHPKQTRGSDLYVGTSMDQLYAQRFGQDTPLPSMELCIENVDQSGGCAYGYSCAYTDMLSWASPTEPLPMIRDPRVAFDLLFGAGNSPSDRLARRRTNQSLLDWIAGEVAHLEASLGATDRQRIERYLENVREIERRIQKVEAQNSSGEPRELPDAPIGVPDSFTEHVQMMFDLQVLAFETDVTRVFSFKTGRDAQNRVYTESESPAAFHPASHHGGQPERVLEFQKINKFQVGQLPYLLKKLESTMEGDRNLLEKSVILWGSPMADGNLHNHRRCPLFLMGHANGGLQGGVHLSAPAGTTMANVMLSLLRKLGLEELDSFGDSTGEFSFTAPATD
jgi:hypothetical protein